MMPLAINHVAVGKVGDAGDAAVDDRDADAHAVESLRPGRGGVNGFVMVVERGRNAESGVRGSFDRTVGRNVRNGGIGGQILEFGTRDGVGSAADQAERAVDFAATVEHFLVHGRGQRLVKLDNHFDLARVFLLRQIVGYFPRVREA